MRAAAQVQQPFYAFFVPALAKKKRINGFDI
jgi:hypothetical protein